MALPPPVPFKSLDLLGRVSDHGRRPDVLDLGAPASGAQLEPLRDHQGRSPVNNERSVCAGSTPDLYRAAHCFPGYCACGYGDSRSGRILTCVHRALGETSTRGKVDARAIWRSVRRLLEAGCGSRTVRSLESSLEPSTLRTVPPCMRHGQVLLPGRTTRQVV